jgi:hypothetical protein
VNGGGDPGGGLAQRRVDLQGLHELPLKSPRPWLLLVAQAAIDHSAGAKSGGKIAYPAAVSGLASMTQLQRWWVGRWVAFRHRRVASALTLVILLLSVSPLAFAHPLDPIWVPGYYDGADYDDAVVTLASAEALLVAPVVWVSQLTVADRMRLRPTPRPVPPISCRTRVIRAPPV